VAKPVRKKDQKRRLQKTEQMPLGRENFMILGTGLGVILAGYLAMLTGGVEGFLPLVVSPILLILGYCVIIPLGILYRKREAGASAEPATPGA
jgi:hypothetical protein